MCFGADFDRLVSQGGRLFKGWIGLVGPAQSPSNSCFPPGVRAEGLPRDCAPTQQPPSPLFCSSNILNSRPFDFVA